MNINSAKSLILVVLVLLTLGAVMLFSISFYAKKNSGDPYYYIKRQAIWLVVGVVACVGLARTDYHRLEKYVWWMYGAAMVGLVLCYVPHIGHKVGGSWRWVKVGGFTLQPSEFGKLATLVAVASWLNLRQKNVQHWKEGVVIPLGIAALPLLLIVCEEDLGTTALLGATVAVVMFVAGVQLRYLLPLGVAGITGLVGMALLIPERAARLFAFMNPELTKDGKGYQVWQALIALGSGGVDGLGLGNSRQKQLYLPEAHTDFIFPVIGEELGLQFTLGIVFCFIVLLMCGMMISLCARDRFGLLLGTGVTVLISLQAVINIGVVTAMLPNKGMPMPFISYGGSNLLMSLMGIGILLNIYRQGYVGPTYDPFAVADFTPKV